MRSTGEVIGLDRSFGVAFAKSQLGAGTKVPQQRHGVRLGARRRQAADRRHRAAAGRPRLQDRRHDGHAALPGGERHQGRARSTRCWKAGPHVVDAIKNGEMQLVFNTTEGKQALTDSRSLRRAALLHKVPYYTTLAGAVAAAQGSRPIWAGTSKSARCRTISKAGPDGSCRPMRDGGSRSTSLSGRLPAGPCERVIAARLAALISFCALEVGDDGQSFR